MVQVYKICQQTERIIIYAHFTVHKEKCGIIYNCRLDIQKSSVHTDLIFIWGYDNLALRNTEILSSCGMLSLAIGIRNIWVHNNTEILLYCARYCFELLTCTIYFDPYKNLEGMCYYCAQLTMRKQDPRLTNLSGSTQQVSAKLGTETQDV